MNRNKTMKNLNALKKATPILLMAAIAPAMATDVNVPLNFTTLPVITITEIQALDFGPVLTLSAAADCSMGTNDVGGTPLTFALEGGDPDKAAYTNTALTQALTGLLSGTCAGAANGDVGIYEITSFKDADITVSVTAGTPTDIAFSPVGYVTDLDEAGGNFSREVLFVGTDADVNASTLLTAFSQIGTNRAIIGGEIINQVGLNAGTPYSTDFNLNVVYQ
jgi:hypothetical protein